MEFMPNPRVFLAFGNFRVTYYALCIVVGAFLCYQFSKKYILKMGYDSELCEDIFYGMLPFALIGARLWYVVFEWEQYVSNPISVFYVWQGGLGIYGGILGALLFGYFFLKKKGLSFLRFGDAILPNMLLAQFCGRWGNFFNQEAYGRAVSADFFKYFPAFIKEKMFINGTYYEPTFLYEGIGNLIGWIIITFLYRKSDERKRGDLFYAYLLWYGTVRFFVEGLRSDSLYIGPIRVSQLTSIILVLIGTLGILGVFRKFSSKKKPVLLFDVDGTLIDSDELIFDSFRYVFSKYEPDLEVTDEMLLSFLGPSLFESFSKWSTKDTNMLVDEYRAYNKTKHDELLKEIPNAKETLAYFKEQGYTIGAVSTKFTDTVHQGLKICGIDEYMDVVIGGDMVQNQKPNPEGIFKACDELKVGYDYVVFTGDSPADIKGAKNFGAYSVGCAWTRKGREILDVEKPNSMIDDISELKDIVKELSFDGD
ncbi:MAG: prolipoprotein diacylglyceryl transferase [Erysipelotrichales bacterium]|nr:prolipoprotein diacylglyceryl transferase [Erysipelotrichales bacterium]